MNEEYLSFERVMRELKIEEDELKKLVSAGELRAFRDAEQTKFKKEDIEKFKTRKTDAEPDAIDLLDSDQDLELEDLPAAGGDDLTEELVFDDVDLGEDVGMKTEPLSGEDLFEVEEERTEEKVEELVIGAGDEALEDEGDTLRTPVAKSRAAAAEEEETEGPAFLGLLVLSAIVLLIGVLVVVDIAQSEPSPMVQWLVGMFKQQ